MNINNWNSRLLQGLFNGIEFLVKDYKGPTEIVTIIVSKTNSKELMHSSLEPVHIVLHANLTICEFDLSQGLAQRFKEKSINSSIRKLPLRDGPGDAIYVVMNDEQHHLLATSSLESVMSMTTLI